VAGHDFRVVDRRVVVVGAARSGVAAARLLAARGARVTLTDTRTTFAEADELRARGVALELGGHSPTTLGNADLIVASPGVALEQPVFDLARARGIETIGELELASRWLNGPAIAITGTKGKSTTTTLVGRMLSAAGKRVLVGGNIGVPLSAQVEESTPETIHVIEASSFQLETTTTFRPWIALWLNFADDHLDRHPSVDAYAAAKARIFANQTADDWAVINADDPTVAERSAGIAAQRVEFSPSGRAGAAFTVEGDWIVRRTGDVTTGVESDVAPGGVRRPVQGDVARDDAGPQPQTFPAASVDRLVPIAAIELTGRHMLHNVIAATATAWLAGVTPQAMIAGLKGFTGLEHVMEPVARIGGVRFVNDSKATNVEAARRSIESFDSGVVAIVGGRFKGGNLRELREPLATRGRAVVAIGEAAPLVRDAVAGVVPVIDAGSMDEAVIRGYAAAGDDGVVLLAPACASFDWFRDYAERGRVFKEAVRRLSETRER
jgi:UDP-N-acetylmuramoylalanine--D-glutamate ligase